MFVFQTVFRGDKYNRDRASGVAVYVRWRFNWANSVSVSDICVPWAGIDMCL